MSITEYIAKFAEFLAQVVSYIKAFFSSFSKLGNENDDEQD